MPETIRPAGKLIHAMVAHLDAVTSLAVDPNGIYLISGSESPASPRSTSCPSASHPSADVLLFFLLRSRLLPAPVEPGQQDLRPGDHGSPQEERGGHL